MVRLATRWRHFNLLILVALKKGYHLGEAYVRRGRRRDLYRRERNSSEGPREEAEIQRKALRRGKNLGFSKETCVEKERVQSKVTPTKEQQKVVSEQREEIQSGRHGDKRFEGVSGAEVLH